MQYNALIPELMVTDIKRSLAFYVDMLGFKIDYEREKFAFISLGDAQIMLEEVQPDSKWQRGQLQKPFGNGVNFQIEVSDLSAIYEKIQKEKLKIFKDLEENIYQANEDQMKLREFLIEDPDGYLLRFAEEV